MHTQRVGRVGYIASTKRAHPITHKPIALLTMIVPIGVYFAVPSPRGSEVESLA